VAELIRGEWGIGLNPRYLCAWLRERGFSPQKPRRRARERDPAAIDRWLAVDWPRIKKRPAAAGRRSC
jgi:transposase